VRRPWRVRAGAAEGCRSSQSPARRRPRASNQSRNWCAEPLEPERAAVSPTGRWNDNDSRSNLVIGGLPSSSRFSFDRAQSKTSKDAELLVSRSREGQGPRLPRPCTAVQGSAPSLRVPPSSTMIRVFTSPVRWFVSPDIDETAFCFLDVISQHVVPMR